MSKTNSSDPLSSDERAQRQAAAAEKKQRAAQEFRATRIRELAEAEAALQRVEQIHKGAQEKAETHTALVSHLAGFYAEVDKLARNKAPLKATDLVVRQINDIIADAKQLVAADLHLDRTKEFVADGSNPVYPDVLLIARSVQQCLMRCAKDLRDREKQTAKDLDEMRMVVTALRSRLDHRKNASREALASVTTAPSDSGMCNGHEGESYFDVNRVGTTDVQRRHDQGVAAQYRGDGLSYRDRELVQWGSPGENRHEPW